MVQELRHLGGDFMLADGLTKKGASSAKLLKVLQTGEYRLPGGWEINQRSKNIISTWMNLNKSSNT